MQHQLSKSISKIIIKNHLQTLWLYSIIFEHEMNQFILRFKRPTTVKRSCPGSTFLYLPATYKLSTKINWQPSFRPNKSLKKNIEDLKTLLHGIFHYLVGYPLLLVDFFSWKKAANLISHIRKISQSKSILSLFYSLQTIWKQKWLT